jgi:DNA or RNA helicases of superfamily II
MYKSMDRIEFQEEAVAKLLDQFVECWKQPMRQIPITLKAPTGSGKTYMTEKFICELTKHPEWYQDVAFIWITFSEDLALQSRDKFMDYFPTSLPGRLLTVDDFQKGILQEKDIMFMNWQKLVASRAENRVRRRPTDERNEKESGYYFEDIIDNTHAQGREIILIIDESHRNLSPAAKRDVINPIDPKIIIKVSATPDSEPSASDRDHHRAGWVEVERQDVINAGLIKREIVCQTEEDIKKHEGEDTDELLLNLAIERREQLVSQIAQFGMDVNPLVIIQLPNNTSVDITDRTKEEIVTDYLISKGVDPSRIAKWFDSVKKPVGLEDNNSSYDFLLFKMAAGTGWDCPRAQILVMFRDIRSDVFQTQTIGRIVRIPILNQQGTEIFKTGYIYTNYSRKMVIDGHYDEPGNKPKVNVSENIKGKAFIPDVLLKTEFMSRADYGDLGKSWTFQQCLIETFNKFFGITNDDIIDEVYSKLRLKHLKLEPKLEQEMFVNARFKDLDQISFDFNGDDMRREWSRHDVEKLFTFMCVDLLKKQTDDDAKISNIARSYGTLKSSLRLWLRNYAFRNESDDTRYRIFLADVINKGADSIFLTLITQTLKAHYPLREEYVKQRREEAERQETKEFKILDTYAFTEEYEPIEMNRCLLNPFYIGKEYDGRENELEFAKYLDGQESIEWWMKNGDTGKDWLSIRYFNEETNKKELFYPDWIYKKIDGTIGIWDTKKGRTASEVSTHNKADELQRRIKILNGYNREGIHYEGGIVIPAGGTWYYNNNEHYSFTPNSTDGWKLFKDLFL